MRITEKPAVVERVQQAVDDLDQTVRDIRSAIFELHTTVVAGHSTRQEILEICADAARVLGFDPVVRFDGPIDTGVDDRVAEHLLAVVREVLANVARHAHAASVEVRVTAAAGQLTLAVEDDGTGPGDRTAGGRGVANMRSRADELGGDLRLGPGEDGTGTRVEWAVPMVKPG
jgi:signal transduction histidine kinase